MGRTAHQPSSTAVSGVGCTTPLCFPACVHDGQSSVGTRCMQRPMHTESDRVARAVRCCTTLCQCAQSSHPQGCKTETNTKPCIPQSEEATLSCRLPYHAGSWRRGGLRNKAPQLRSVGMLSGLSGKGAEVVVTLVVCTESTESARLRHTVL
ncbi:hypothetical protein B0H15DRAFT_816785 [Mycena belliarum]|uniref:Uncharacterized protein n=1 Tax=Mycena belliarum TaxID=1033014 RepID=A0AAD6UFE2_9AGAR|nr:hypothetical protein B0H15DRAFT_816785 [Mycena belliae]